jgi:hypothetical protein
LATYPALAATSEAILGLLQRAAIGTEFDGVAFEHSQASNFLSPMTDGIALYLYRVTVSANRNLPPRLGRDRVSEDGREKWSCQSHRGEDRRDRRMRR